jgi:carbonic anhydrase
MWIAFPVLVSVFILVGCGTRPAEAPTAHPAADTAPHEGPHWDYGPEASPAAWGRLSPEFAACSEGRSQSPIDLAIGTPAAMSPLPQYRPAALRIVHHEHKADVVNTGHSIQVDYPDADTLTVGNETFALLQYHFHSPSEHTVGGRHFPMEMHLVHKSDDGRLAVVGVFIEEGAPNAAFDPIWDNLPAEKGGKRHYEDVKVDVDQLLPSSRATWRYEGSLTTPPCSEGVTWFVMKTPIQLSPSQISKFQGILMGNNRPVQPLNDRTVVMDAVP